MTVPVFNVKVPREQQPPEPLEIRASGDAVATMLRTPGHDRELALGLLFALGLIESTRDVATVTHCGRVGDDSRRNTIDVRAAPGFAFDLDRAGQHEQRSVEGDTLHAAALLDEHGAVLARGQDVDVLNAVDKAVGAWLLRVELQALATKPITLAVSGPATRAIEHRASRAGVAVVHGALDLDR